MSLGQVAALFRYPVKSLGGERVERVDIGQSGPRGDRLWAVRDVERDVTTDQFVINIGKMQQIALRVGLPASS